MATLGLETQAGRNESTFERARFLETARDLGMRALNRVGSLVHLQHPVPSEHFVKAEVPTEPQPEDTRTAYREGWD